MEPHRKICLLSGMGTIFLLIGLITAVPTIGFSQYHQTLPENYNIEQVFTPFSGIDRVCDFCFYPDLIREAFPTAPVVTDNQFILNAVNRSVSVVLHVQGTVVASVTGISKPFRIITYPSEYKDEDDMRV